jgi:hypothetical protein
MDPNSRREEMAKANAIAARSMEQVDDVRVGPGVPTPEAEKPEMRKSTTVQQGELVTRTDAADLAVMAYMEGNDFYTGSAPSLGPQPAQLQKSELCKSCGSSRPVMFHSCPSCGDGAVVQDVRRYEEGGTLVKSEEPAGRPALRLVQDEDLYLPNGVVESSEE